MDIKRITALLLVFMLALALLCACNDNGDEETNGESVRTEEKTDGGVYESEGDTVEDVSDLIDDENESMSDEAESETFGAYEEEEKWEGPIITN